MHLATPTTTQTDLRFLFSVIPNQLHVIFSFSKYSQPILSVPTHCSAAHVAVLHVALLLQPTAAAGQMNSTL